MGMSRTAALSIDDFALFARVAELRNLSAVARERDVPPSQVSRALARIEGQCGVRLVHRTTHGLSLTDEGERVASHGARLLALAAELDGELDDRRAEPSGLVRLATSHVFALFLLPALEPLLARHPRLCIEIVADDLPADMARDGIDIAVRAGEVGPEGLVARPLGSFTRVVCAAPAYLARHGTPRHPGELASHRLIGSSARPLLNRWPFIVDGALREVRAGAVLRASTTAVALAMGVEGLGIVRPHAGSAAPHLAAGRLLPLLEAYTPHEPMPINAVMLPDRQRLPKVRACVEHFAAWFAALR
jgi:DNA-binding transcriptional LysR family regulator